MSMSGSSHSSCVVRANTPYVDPVQKRRGYSDVHLTGLQHGAVILGASGLAAWLAQPISKLQRFYFISDVPGESNRVYYTDKRAEFFRVVFGTRWWSGGSTWLLRCGGYAMSIALFVYLRDVQLSSILSPFSAASGCASGALTGLAYSVVRHPVDVLRATADAPNGPKAFTGPMDVLRTAIVKKPSVLLGLYKGVIPTSVARGLQLGAQFGCYNYLRQDGVYRGAFVLFLYCHFAALVGYTLQYPIASLRQQLRAANASTRGRPLTYRSLAMDLRRRHGLSKVFDGYFRSRPILHAVPTALVLWFYDLGSRRYSEYLHPDLHASPRAEQSLTLFPIPSHAKQRPAYEFQLGGKEL